MSTPVLSDAQMGMFQIIRPIPNFEQLYQGKLGTIPIAFPGTLDAQAGTTGLSPNLLAGISVPLGGRLLLQIPMTISADFEPPVSDAYAYQLIWRTRNQSAVSDAILAGRPATAFHLPSEAPGRNQFAFIPGCSDIEVFEQGENASAPAYLDVVQQRYRPRIGTPWVQPLTPAGNNGVWQQGVYNSQIEACTGPSWVPLWLDASGDELLILAYKIDGDSTWDFAGDDLPFSSTYGNASDGPPAGLLLSTGTMGG